MTTNQQVETLRLEAEHLWQVAIKARRAAALKEREYRTALGEALGKLITEYNELAERPLEKEKTE